MATKLGSSPALKLGAWVLAIVFVFYAISWIGTDAEIQQSSSGNSENKNVDPRAARKAAEQEEKEKGALANDIKQLYARFEQLKVENSDLRSKVAGLKSDGSNSGSSVSEPPVFSEADLERLVQREVDRRLAKMSKPATGTGTTNMNVGQSTEQALLAFEKGNAGVGLDGYVVGTSSGTSADEQIEWLMPEGEATDTKGTVFDGFFDKAAKRLDFESGGSSDRSGSNKKTLIPYAAIDRDAILYNAMVLTDLIGVVATGDTVQAPFKFKLELSQENLATSGLYMPHIAMMRLSGFARGEWATGCVEGIITGATFVFEDGTISETSVGAGEKSDGKQLGYLSDLHGSPCIKGVKYSNLMEYAGVAGGLSALAAAGDALASAQYSVQKGSDNILQTFDGSLLSNAVGQGASEGLNTVNQVIATRYANVRDLVVAPAGRYVVMMNQQLNIDYDPEGRKLLNENFNQDVEAYYEKKLSAANH